MGTCARFPPSAALLTRRGSWLRLEEFLTTVPSRSSSRAPGRNADMTELGVTNRPGLLLIEGDADTLTRQGHTALGDEIARIAKSASPSSGLRFHRVPLRSERDVRLGESFARFARYPAIVLIAHGDPQGIVVGPRLAMNWDTAGRMLAPLEPRVIVPISCYGGMSGPALSLFHAIPSLETIVGSPAPISTDQARLATLEALVGAFGMEVPKEVSLLLLGLNALATDGILFRRSRETIMRATPTELMMMDLLGIVAASSIGGRGGNLPTRRRVRGGRQRQPRHSRAEPVAVFRR